MVCTPAPKLYNQQRGKGNRLDLKHAQKCLDVCRVLDRETGKRMRKRPARRGRRRAPGLRMPESPRGERCRSSERRGRLRAAASAATPFSVFLSKFFAESPSSIAERKEKTLRSLRLRLRHGGGSSSSSSGSGGGGGGGGGVFLDDDVLPNRKSNTPRWARTLKK